MKVLRKCVLGVLAITMAAAVVALIPSKRVEAAGSVAINEENFPDDVFRQWVLDNCDTNSNGYLSDDEIKNVTEIDISYHTWFYTEWVEEEVGDGVIVSHLVSHEDESKSIKSIEGINFFTNLRKLNCKQCDLSSLDVSGLTNLEYLDFSSNDVTNYNFANMGISELPNLKYLDCSYNNISDISIHSVSLEELNFKQLGLNSLDLKGCASLKRVEVESNSSPSYYGNFDSLDITYCSKLESFSFNGAGYSPITKFDFTGCNNIKDISITNSLIENLKFDDEDVNWFNLHDLSIEGNELLKSIDVSNCDGLEYVSLTGNESLVEIKLNSDLSMLKEFYCWDCSLSNIDLSGAKNLTNFSLFSGVVPVSIINLSGCSSLTECGIENTSVSYFSLQGCSSLQYLTANKCGLTGFDFSNCSNLKYLNLDNNNLTKLDLSSCIKLSRLDCANNSISELILPTSSSLVGLFCDHNQLTSLDISSHPNIEGLSCSGNNISTLDIRNNPGLLDLYYKSYEIQKGGIKYYTHNQTEAAIEVDSDVTIILPKFNISVGSVKNGSIKLSKSEASFGEMIDVTVIPSSGYELDTISVNGSPIDGKSFKMPAQATTINVTFKKLAQTPTPTNKPTATPTPTNKPTVKPTATPTPTVKPKAGWVKNSNDWYYFDKNGNKVTGWIQDGKNWYYLNGSGVMQTGWVDDGGKWYYMSGSGAMTTSSWIQSGGKWYYMGSSGAMATGWIEDGGKWYYMSSSGAMTTGWLQSGGKWYYMSPSGAMATGWVQSGSKWYYMSPSGAMVANGWVKSGNTWYYFDATGAMVTGEFEIDGKKSNFSSSGAWLGYA